MSLFGSQQQPPAGQVSQPQNPAPQGSLFGGNFQTGAQNLQKPQGTSSLFGTTTSTTPAQPTQSLFGNLTTGQQTPQNSISQPQQQTSLFGNQPQQQAQAQQPQQQQQTTSSLFGNPSNTNSLFCQPQTNQGPLFPKPFTGFGNPSQPFLAGVQTSTTNPNSLFGNINQTTTQQQPQVMRTTEEQRSINEVEYLINFYRRVLDPQSEQNRFRACVYNQIDKGLSDDQKKFLAENVPTNLQGNPVDVYKWLQAVEKNPIRSKLVPTQLNSVSELKERAKKTLEAVKKANERLKTSQKNLKSIRETCDEDLRNAIANTQDKNTIIRSRLTRIFGKFERILHEQGRAKDDKQHQTALLNSQKAYLASINHSKDGILTKLDYIKRKNREISLNLQRETSNENTQAESVSESEKLEVTDQDLRDILRVLEKQRQGNEILKKSVGDSARAVIVMDRELDLASNT